MAADAAGEISGGKLHSATFYLPQKNKQPFPSFPSWLFQSSLLWNIHCLVSPAESCSTWKKNSFSVYMWLHEHVMFHSARKAALLHCTCDENTHNGQMSLTNLRNRLKLKNWNMSNFDTAKLILIKWCTFLAFTFPLLHLVWTHN